MSVVIRDAKLFEAAEYPDRSITFTEADLDAIVAGFRDPIPVRVQHGPSPWEGRLGRVVRVWRDGVDLLGRIEFPVAVWDFLCKMGTKALSVGFDYRMRRLEEVSVVDRPRVLTARVYSDTITNSDKLVLSMAFDVSDDDSLEVFSMEGAMNVKELQSLIDSAVEKGRAAGLAAAEAAFADREKSLLSEIAERDRRDAKAVAAVKIASWKAEGKLSPAAEKFAESILIDGVNQVTFSDGGHMSAAEAFIQFMAYQPVIVPVSGSSFSNSDVSGLTPLEKKVFDELGVTVDEVEQFA